MASRLLEVDSSSAHNGDPLSARAFAGYGRLKLGSQRACHVARGQG